MKTEWAASADAARRREPTVGQEAVSSRSRTRRIVRSRWLPQRHGRLNTAHCLRAKGVATTKQRVDRAVGPTAALCAQMRPLPLRFFNELKSHPRNLKSTEQAVEWMSICHLFEYFFRNCCGLRVNHM